MGSETGSVSSDVIVFDSGMNHVRGLSSVYLIRSEQRCLIDAGPQEGARILVRDMATAGVFPPDIIILTHSHADHCQAVPYLRNVAERQHRPITVYAGRRALPYLADQSFNRSFEPKHHYEPIFDVVPLDEGAIIDLGRIRLKVLEIPGHHDDQIALYDERSGDLFVGDALGLCLRPGIVIPTIMPPFFDREAYLKSISRLREIKPARIGIGHYGFFSGESVEAYFDQLELSCRQWWDVLEKADAEGILDDLDVLKDRILTHTTLTAASVDEAKMEINNPFMRISFDLMNRLRKLFGRNPLSPSEMFLPTYLEWTVKGYRSNSSRS